MNPPQPATHADSTAPRASRAHNYALRPIATTTADRFGWWWLGAVALWALLWPILTLAIANSFTDPTANFIDQLYRRKAVALATHPPAGAGRIVIVGGSDALFGIDAEQLQRELGVPAVNYATHAALGIEYTLDRAQRVLQPGDSVVLELAYGMWADQPGDFGEYEFAYFNSYDKAYYARMGFLRALRTLYSVPLGRYADSLRNWWAYGNGAHLQWTRVYNVATLSANGDLRQDIPGSFIAPGGGVPWVDPEPKTAGAVRAFAAWARARGIRLYYTWPCVARPDAPLSDAALTPPPWMDRLFVQSGIAVLDRPGENLYPRDWFYDTDKHLNSSARRIRTSELARRLAGERGIELHPDTSIFLLGSPDAGLAPLTNLGRAPVRYVYLVDAPIDDPRAMTAQQVAAAIADGQAVVYDDLTVEPLLALQGLHPRRVVRQEADLAAFIRRYDRHLLVALRNAGAPWPTEATAALPKALAEALASPAPFVLAAGTGPYAGVTRFVGAGKRLRGAVAELVKDAGPRLDIDADAAKNVLKINGREVAPAARGLRLAVLDPASGLLVDSATFPGPGSVATVRRRFQATINPPRISVTIVPLQLSDFVSTGSHPPLVTTDRREVTLRATGANGVWGWAIHAVPGARDGALVLEVAAPPESRYSAVLMTNRPELFAFLPPPRVLTGDGTVRPVGIRWQLRDGAAFGENDYAFAALIPDPTVPLHVQNARRIDFDE